jgi:hypothetical protein
MKSDKRGDVRQVLELDASAATVYVERPEQTPREGGRWLVFPGEVVWELPNGGYRLTDRSPESFPGSSFMLAAR